MTEVNTPRRRSRSQGKKDEAKDHWLLTRLVDTPFFKFLLGKPDASDKTARPSGGSAAGSDQHDDHPKQSIGSMCVDVVLFSLLVLVVPFWTIFRWIANVIRRSWGTRFVLGTLAGAACLGTLAWLLWSLFN
jgi:hypothetical protein